MNTSLKTCFKCGAEKSLDGFYKHTRMADGHLNKCKECTKLDGAIHRRRPEVAERLQSYDRAREKTPERRTKKLIYERRHRERHPDRALARCRVNNAVRDGKLKRKACEVCGEKAQAHHMDYSIPLGVRWLCFKHHRNIPHKQAVK